MIARRTAHLGVAILAITLSVSCGVGGRSDTAGAVAGISVTESQYLLGDFGDGESLLHVTVGQRVGSRMSGDQEEPGSEEFVRLEVEIDAVLFGRSPDDSIVVEVLAFAHRLGKDSDESAAASFNGFVPARWEPGTELVLAVTWTQELGVHRLTSSRLLGVLDGDTLRVGSEMSDLHLLGLVDRATVEQAARGVVDLPVESAPGVIGE